MNSQPQLHLLALSFISQSERPWEALSNGMQCERSSCVICRIMWIVHKWHLGGKSTRQHVAPSRFFHRNINMDLFDLNNMYHYHFHDKCQERICNNAFFYCCGEKCHLINQVFSHLRAWICGFVCVSFHFFLWKLNCSTDTHSTLRLFNTTQQKAWGLISIAQTFHKVATFTSKYKITKIQFHIWAPEQPGETILISFIRCIYVRT